MEKRRQSVGCWLGLLYCVLPQLLQCTDAHPESRLTWGSERLIGMTDRGCERSCRLVTLRHDDTDMRYFIPLNTILVLFSHAFRYYCYKCIIIILYWFIYTLNLFKRTPKCAFHVHLILLFIMLAYYEALNKLKQHSNFNFWNNFKITWLIYFKT